MHELCGRLTSESVLRVYSSAPVMGRPMVALPSLLALSFTASCRYQSWPWSKRCSDSVFAIFPLSLLKIRDVLQLD